jgi:hypothetical protein
MHGGSIMRVEKRRILFKSIRLLPAIAILVLPVWNSIASADEAIVGFWQVTWTDATSKAVVNNVWDVWHSDHTETQDDFTDSLWQRMSGRMDLAR